MISTCAGIDKYAFYLDFKSVLSSKPQVSVRKTSTRVRYSTQTSTRVRFAVRTFCCVTMLCPLFVDLNLSANYFVIHIVYFSNNTREYSLNREKMEFQKNAQNDKIENVAGSVWLSLFMDSTGKCTLPSKPLSKNGEILNFEMHITLNVNFNVYLQREKWSVHSIGLLKNYRWSEGCGWWLGLRSIFSYFLVEMDAFKI
jgi:hypothetical protein